MELQFKCDTSLAFHAHCFPLFINNILDGKRLDLKKFLIFNLLYYRDEIEFLLQCCERNHDGKIDYIGFTQRFHEPAKEIGFNLAVLLTNLSEHMPNEPR